MPTMMIVVVIILDDILPCFFDVKNKKHSLQCVAKLITRDDDAKSWFLLILCVFSAVAPSTNGSQTRRVRGKDQRLRLDPCEAVSTSGFHRGALKF